jgi:hypothetical protein
MLKKISIVLDTDRIFKSDVELVTDNFLRRLLMSALYEYAMNHTDARKEVETTFPEMSEEWREGEIQRQLLRQRVTTALHADTPNAVIEEAAAVETVQR